MVSKFLGKIKRPSTGQLITWGIGLVLAIALAIFLRNFVACWQFTALAGMPPAFCSPDTEGNTGEPQVNAEGTPIAPAEGTPVPAAPIFDVPEPWDGGSRVTILLVGLDARDIETDGPPRTDTMIVLTVDPLSRTAGMMSIPRDLWVNIPGFGYGRINTAYALGEAYSLPGGGPGLAMKTVENLLGVPVQYYAQIDFETFEEMIGAIGGVDVYVEEAITIDPRGNTEDTVTLQPGWNHLDGSLALAYARERHTEGGDVDRARRTQQVIMAIRDKVMDPAMFPEWVASAPGYYAQLQDGIHTNMSLDDAVRLAVLVQQIPAAEIRQAQIGYSELILTSVNVGDVSASVFQPIPDQIRLVRDDIFGSGALSPMAACGDATQCMQSEAARVIFVNGTGTAGMASTTATFFQGQGMNVVAYGNPADYPDEYIANFPNQSVIIIHSGKPYVISYLMGVMGLGSPQLVFDFDPGAPADIVVGLGYDWSIP
jgi:LCP family protein required for cell wall assembly